MTAPIALLATVALLVYKRLVLKHDKLEEKQGGTEKDLALALAEIKTELAIIRTQLQTALDLRPSIEADHKNVIELNVQLESFREDIKRNWDALREVKKIQSN